jgi:anaerobic magnesium-protoporphyrin IX monomethyl ester cyclase
MAEDTKRILFLIPPFFHIHDYISRQHTSQHPVFTIPYGVLSLAAYVRANAKYPVRMEVLDLNLEAYKLCNTTGNIEEGIKKIIKDTIVFFDPNIVGISALFNTCFNYLELISGAVKGMDKNALLVIGGGLATNLYKEILSTFEHIDACCYGEGEIPLCALANADSTEQHLKSDPSWITRESLIESRLPQYNFIQNLDEIPFFDYSLIDLDNYMGRSLDKSYSQQSMREISIHTSRGCPFNCVYCSNGTVHGKKIRYMSVEKVISEVEQMINQYSIDVLLIEDDHFLSDKERAKKILKRFSDFHLKIEFPNGIAVYAIDDTIGELLGKAAVTTISLAVESGSDFVLKNIINKPLRVAMIKPAVDILRRNGISVHAFIVTGLPGEMEKHRDETMRMISDVGFDWVKFFLAIPIAGSRLYDICKESGYIINTDFSQYVTTKANIITPDLDPAYIEDKVYLMNLEANFMRNFNVMTRNYHKASVHFENIVKRYPDHAFAHYCLAKVYEGLGRGQEIIGYHRDMFMNITGTDSTWARYAKYFGISVS